MNKFMTNARIRISCADLADLDSRWNTGLFNPMERCIPFGRIYFPLEGEGQIVHNGRTIILRRGKLVLIPPLAKIFVSCGSRLVKYWCHFNVQWGEGGSDIFSLFPDVMEHPVPEEDYPYFCSLFQRVRKDFFRHNNAVLPESEEWGAVSALVLILEPFLSQLSQKVNPPQLERLQELIQYMSLHLAEDLSLQQLAHREGLHPNYLIALFRQTTGISPIAYLTQLRIRKAMAELRKPEVRIGEVAAAVGIRDAATFTRFFSRHAGISPRAYRKALKGIGELQAPESSL